MPSEDAHNPAGRPKLHRTISEDAIVERRPAGFAWCLKSEEAAQLLALAELTKTEIAGKVGIARSTLWEWSRNPDFAARVESHLEEIRAEIRRRGIGVIERRVASLDDRWKRLQRIMQERGESPEMKDVPGGRTGLLVRNVKSIGAGEDAQVVEEFKVDTGLLAELREHERQAAQELGQWTSKADVTSKGEAIADGPVFHIHGNGRGPTTGEIPRHVDAPDPAA
jgi:Helix-turn-helix of insertion element transposase